MIFTAITALAMVWLAQLEDLPETPSPLTEGAERLIELTSEASSGSAALFDELWTRILQGGMYEAMADVGTLAAVLMLGFFLVQLTQQLLSGEGDGAFTRLIWPLIVTVLLANNGAVLASITLEMRSVGNQINTAILDSTVASVSLEEEFQQNRLGAGIDELEAASISECAERFQGRRSRARQGCITVAREEANRLRQQYGLIPADEGWIQSALQFLLRNFLYAIHMAFQWAVEIVLLIIALLGPLAVGLSLTPSNSKPLIAWVSGFASIFLMKLTLNLISGIAAYAFSLQDGLGNSLLLPILLGLVSPILSVLVGLEGGSAFFNALSTASVYMGYRKAFGIGKAGVSKSYKFGMKRLQKLRRR